MLLTSRSLARALHLVPTVDFPALVTREVVRRIRDEQDELLRSLAQVHALCDDQSDAQLEAHLQALERALLDHVRRVDGLLKATAAPL